MNIRLVIAYDGTRYYGWQKTATGPSVEQTMEEVLEKILQHDVVLQAASRTDAGVHAEGQVVNFHTQNEAADLSRLLVSLNQLLPGDIAVLTIEKAEDKFHPTLDAVSKEYHYEICSGHARNPVYRHYSWHVHYPLDVEAMRKGAEALIGEHDFSAFCNVKKNEETSDFIRRIDEIEIIELPKNRLRISIKGNRFLYRMARNIVGTLLYVGRQKIANSDVATILKGKKRIEAGVTAPAHGLKLYRVNYGESESGRHSNTS